MLPAKSILQTCRLLMFTLFACTVWVGCGPKKPAADLIYINASVETMDSNSTKAQAVAIHGGVILAVGTNEEILAFRGPATTIHDMRNAATILQGFFDSHSHMLGFGVYSDPAWVDVSSVNVLFKPLPGDPRCTNPSDYQQCFIPVKNQDDVIERLKKAVASPSAIHSPESPVLAFNYDPSRLGHSKLCRPLGQGFECPNFEDGHALEYLNALSRTRPILVSSESGHIVYVNSLELHNLNICGTPGAGPNCHHPIQNVEVETMLANLGQLDEDLAVFAVSKAAQYDKDSLLKLAKVAAQAYAGQGFTTVQEGAASKGEIDLYEVLTREKDFPVSATVLVYEANSPKVEEIVKAEVEIAENARKANRDNPDLTIAAIKLFADGSTQGYTGLLLQPYAHLFPPFTNPKISPRQPYTGLPDFTESDITLAAAQAHRAGFPVAIHQNGNGAIRDALAGVNTAGINPEFHDIMIHFSASTPADLAEAKKLNAGVTLLMENLYFYGLPFCQQILGPDRTRSLYPANSALSAGLRIGLHSDTPVTPPDPLFAVWVAKTRDRQRIPWYHNHDEKNCPVRLGHEESISIKQGIKAYTVDAAWMYGLDNKVGTLERGKVADMVILSEDPLNMEDTPDKLKTIRVLGTVHRGKFFANPNANYPPIWPGDPDGPADSVENPR